MKRLFLLAVVSLVSLILALTSCDNTNNDTGVNPPGSNTDTNFTAFWDEFQGMDELTGDMVDQTFGFIDSIFTIGSLSKTSIVGTDTLIYHDDSKFWYVVSDPFNEDDSSTTFHIVDSLQFWHGSVIVQWPNHDSLTKIISYLTLTANGLEGLDSGLMHQNITIISNPPGSDTITINGTGDINAAYSYQDIDMNDTTNCSVNMNFNMTYTNIQIDVAFMDSADACPFAGSVNYSGSFNMSCTGGMTVSLSGNWNVLQTFNNGIITYTTTHDNHEWTKTDTCTYDNTNPNDTTGNDTTGNDTTGNDTTVNDSIMFTSFMDELEGVDKMNGVSVDQSMRLVDSIFSMNGTYRDVFGGTEDTLVYHDGSQYWYAVLQVMDEDDSSLIYNIIDSLQLWHGSVIVQWPNPDSLSLINNNFHLSAMGPGIIFGEMNVNGNFAPVSLGSDTLSINGTGNFSASYSFADTSMYDTTSCLVDTMGFSITYSNIILNPAMMDSTGGCPPSGTVNYNGNFDMNCTGTNNISMSGTWIVLQTFSGGTITFDIDHDGKHWTHVDTCN